MESIKFEGKEIEEGNIYYVLDPDIKDLPPLKLIATRWSVKCFNRGEKYGDFIQEFPNEIMEEWKKEYGTNKRKWKEFQKNLPKKGWFFFDKLMISK